MMRQLILTEDGSHTIFVPALGEHYHSVHGALQESRHIFIQNGYQQVPFNAISILEIGFGTGLNALLTLLATETDKKLVQYEAWEAFPLSEEEILPLNYPALAGCDPALFSTLHRSAWEIENWITPCFNLKKVCGNGVQFQSNQQFDLVYFDAFGPDYQPELWETVVFTRIGNCLKKGSRLVTYSAKGQVRRNLRSAGFIVEKAPGPPGKREITIAIKQ